MGIAGGIPGEIPGGILIEGEKIVEPHEGVAMLFQYFGLFPRKTVYNKFAYGIRMAGRFLRRSLPRLTGWACSSSPMRAGFARMRRWLAS
jgi:ABC-type sugar transport system ATPase subunit